MPKLIPLALQDAPALIEAVFPAQKVSFEAQRERKAGAGQTLTALGSYWKGRKPLILVRAIVLGSLLPQTGDAEKDLEIFEKLMAFDGEGLARRALIQKKIKPKDIAALIELDNPWHFFKAKIRIMGLTGGEIRNWRFPLDTDAEGITISWRRDLNEQEKIAIFHEVLSTFPSYEAKAALCKRPEELDQTWLYEPVWKAVNRHYAHLGIDAHSHQELIEQLGILRYGHRPKVGDTFCGGGSIPFEAARLGCDVYASDLNPIACMLTWGALNIIGASPERRLETKRAQREVAEEVDREITELGVEHDSNGNRAYAFLYCLETRCPESGWMVPMLPTLAISKRRYDCRVYLVQNTQEKRYDIEVKMGVSKAEMDQADEQGTIQDGNLIHIIDGKKYSTSIKTLRGDYRDNEGNTQNRLRRWKKTDFKPTADDIFQERLYAIQWITKETLDQSRKETFFSSVAEEDLQRERHAETLVGENLLQWQAEGLVPDMEIEPGYNTDQPIRERGWTHWHHLFNPRLSQSLQQHLFPCFLPFLIGVHL